jgi:hypothetical protein
MWGVPFSLEGSKLHAESGVLDRDSGMAAEEESHETKQGEDEDRHEPRFLVAPALKVKPLRADRLLANYKDECRCPEEDCCRSEEEVGGV